ncbi:MAG TPA: polymer-forming cytoskeletal protein [Caulobacteraceae bacterium]|nr:polymer-forming cytoskeletal protein [Caulobacteraceae bacterium]
MFSKQDSRPGAGKATATPESSRRQPKVASVISEDLVVSGGLTSEGEVHVEGKVHGDVRVARLTLGETGVVEGSVVADTVDIRGTVIGPITGKVVRLFAASHVEGDVTHDQLSVETGAYFEGRSLKLQRPPAVELAAE